jgi:hypothetical protein
MQPNEEKLMKRAREGGFEVYGTTGWPDFLLVKNGVGIFIEEKSSVTPLSEHQERLLRALDKVGMCVRIVLDGNPEKLFTIDEFVVLSRKRNTKYRFSPRKGRYHGQGLTQLYDRPGSE